MGVRVGVAVEGGIVTLLVAGDHFDLEYYSAEVFFLDAEVAILLDAVNGQTQQHVLLGDAHGPPPLKHKHRLVQPVLLLLHQLRLDRLLVERPPDRHHEVFRHSPDSIVAVVGGWVSREVAVAHSIQVLLLPPRCHNNNVCPLSGVALL